MCLLLASQSIDIERFSDREKMKAKPTRDSFMQFLEANASNFPRELVAGLQSETLFFQTVSNFACFIWFCQYVLTLFVMQ